MKRVLTVLTSVMIGIVIVAFLILGCKEMRDRQDERDQPIGIFEPQQIIEREYTVCFEETGDVATDTAYLIIDLSDTTAYPHEETNAIRIAGWRFQGAATSTHEWHAHLGVVTENDATDGTAEFFTFKILVGLTGIFETQTYWEERPLDLWVEDDSLLYVSTNITHTDTTWQNDVAISATMDITDFVAAGDLVLYMVEVADGSTVDFSLCVEYDTR